MLIRRNKQRVWVYSDFDAERNTRRHNLQPPRKPQGLDGHTPVIQARRPILGKLGRCLAVRLSGAELEVLVAHPERQTRWYPAAQALTERQAEAWSVFGFGR